MKKKILHSVLLLILLIPIGLVSLTASETGSRWLLHTLIANLSVDNSVERIEGRLLDHIALFGLHYQTEAATADINRLAFSWRPSVLFLGKLKIVDLSIDGVVVNVIGGQDKPETESGFNGHLKLPVKLDIDRFLLTDAVVQTGDSTHRIDKLEFAVATEDERLRLVDFMLESDLINADAKGDALFVDDTPLNLVMHWRVNTGANGMIEGQSLIDGNLKQLALDNHINKPFSLSLKGHIEDVLKMPRLNIQANWRELNWPLVGEPRQIQSPEGQLILVGPLDAYNLNVNAKLNQKFLPQANFRANAKGSLSAINLDKLSISSQTGIFELKGQASWQNVPAFALTASGKNFNPGIIVPELPGNLTFVSHINGKLIPNSPEITAEINHLNGQLRRQPFNGQGRLDFINGNLAVDDLQLALGKNTLQINGKLDQHQGDLDFLIDMPHMATLWPGLTGKLVGNGQFKGGWNHPSINLALQGKSLQFQQHGINDLSLAVDYVPDDKKNSQINFVANRIASEKLKINKLTMTGTGSLKQHAFTADILSESATLKAALNGSLTDKLWRGELSQFDICESKDRSWSLTKNALIRVTQQSSGFDASLSETCVVHGNASVCAKGDYFANGNLNAVLGLKAMPSKLVKPFLPERLAINTFISGKGELQSKNKVMSGQYQFNTTPAHIILKTDVGDKHLKFGSSDITGSIQGSHIAVNANLNLSGQDTISSQMKIDTGKAQTLSGQLMASINDFSMVQVLAPQLTDVKGRLLADLSLQGSLTKPVVIGNIELVNGHLDVGRLGLRQVNLHAQAIGERGNPIHLNGSTIPVMLNSLEAKEKLELKTMLKYSAEMRQSDKFNGNFRLQLSPETSITLHNGQDENRIKLGSSSLSGVIRGDELVADLDIALSGQDFVRGALSVNTAGSQAISGTVKAAIQNLHELEMFSPELTNVKGMLSADLTVAGTAQKPLVNGAVSLANGQAEIAQLGITVRDLNLKAEPASLDSDEIRLRGSAKSGEGQLKLEGSAFLRPEEHWLVRLAMIGSDFEVAKLPEAEIAISPDLQLQATATMKKLSGEIAVPKALLKLQELPENAVKVSEDEIILGEEKPEQPKLPQPDIQADIEIKLGKNVKFSGQGLETALGGRLKIVKAGEKLAMQGNVDLTKASYKRFGQDLTVRKGRFVFNGPVDNPWLDVEATRLSKSKKVTAVLSLTGTLKNPKTKIYSEPALPETEALAYLVTGNPLSQASKADSNMLASAALSYGAGKAGWLADKLGVNEFAVEEGSTLKDTLLTMGQYLTPDFYIGTKIGMFNKQAALVMKHKLTDNINVETQTGTSQRIKLNYEFDRE